MLNFNTPYTHTPVARSLAKGSQKYRHQQDLNLRPQRGTDNEDIRICRRNHLAIVP